MEFDDDLQLRPDLIAELHDMVRQATPPSQMLAWLKPRVDDKHSFTAYMEAACLDNDCDEGTIWLVASRWWTGNQTAYGADRLLIPIFDQCRERWQRHQQSHQGDVHDE
jgi:hypothetical protein